MSSRHSPTFAQLLHERDGLVDLWMRRTADAEERNRMGRYLATGKGAEYIPTTIRILQEKIQEALA